MKKWEYKVLKLDAIGFKGGIIQKGILENELNKLGKEGWELISAFDTNQENGRSREILVIFKKSSLVY